MVATDIRGAAFAVLSPRAVSPSTASRRRGSPRNTWAGTVDSLDIIGDRVRVGVAGPEPVVAEITLQARHDLHLLEGDTVWVSMKATEFDVYPA